MQAACSCEINLNRGYDLEAVLLMPVLDFSGAASAIFCVSSLRSIHLLLCGRVARHKATHHIHTVPGRDAKSNNYRLIENLVDPDETIIQRHDPSGEKGYDVSGMTLLFRRAEAGKKHQQTSHLECTMLGLVFAAAVLQLIRAYCAAAPGSAVVPGLRERTMCVFIEATAWLLAVLLVKCEDLKEHPRSYVVIGWWISTLLLRLCAAAVMLNAGSGVGDNTSDRFALGLWITQTVLCAALVTTGISCIAAHRRSHDWQRYRDELAKLRVTGQSSFARLLRVVQQDIVYIIVAILAASTVAGSTIFFNIIWGGLIQEVQNSNRPGLERLIYELAGVCVTIGIASALQSFYVQLAGVRLVLRLQNLAYASLLEQEIAWFDCNNTGELMTVLSTNTQMVQDGLTTNLVNAIKGGVTVSGIMIYLFLISWKLTLIFTACALVPFAILGCLGVLVAKYSKLQTDAQAKQGQLAQETLSSMSTVKSFAQEENVINTYRAASRATYAVAKKLTYATSLLAMVGLGGFYGVFAVGFDVGGILAIDGEIDAAFLLSFVLLSFQMILNLGAVVAAIPAIATAIGASQRIFELIDRRPAIRFSGGSTIAQLKGAIQFKDVKFHYPSRPHVQILRGISTSIKAGQQVAFVGPSGSGKSTLLSLVQGFYKPTSGSVSIDGYNIEDLDPLWLRRQIGVVLQEPVLFSGTIHYNLTFGNPSATRDQIQRAATDANAHEFISQLPDGYQTELGERGVSLSGGQKQRVAIARALLKNPRLLLLDEATSALDSESEDLVQDALDRLMANRTTLVIAHRLSTIEDSDVICVVQAGKIVESGTHASLLEAGGLYASLSRKDMLDDE